MFLLRVVIIQACTPFLFILAVKWTQESSLGEYGTLFCVLITFLFCFILPLKLTKYITVLKEKSFISAVFFGNVCVHMQRIVEKDKLIFYDALAFIDYQTVFQACYLTVNYVATLVYYLYCEQGLRPFQILTHLTWLLFHAILLLWVIDSVFSYAWTSSAVVLARNFAHDYHNNNTLDFPDGYLQLRVLERTKFIKSSYVRDVYFQTREETLFVGSFPQNSTNYPLSVMSIERYLGEDVEFDCSHQRSHSHLSDNLKWLHNNGTVSNSGRHMIKRPIVSERINATHKYKFTATLRIERLKEDDFGVYKCISEELENLSENDFDILKRTLFVFKLYRMKYKPRIIYRSIGSLIASNAFFLYHTDADRMDLSLEYTVNNQLLENTCDGNSVGVCSLAVNVLSWISNLGIEQMYGPISLPFLYVGPYGTMPFKRAIIYFCLCDRAYGIHKVSFMRDFFNKRTKSYQTEEYEHPLKFIILPDARASFFRWFDDTDIYNRLAADIDKEDNWQNIEVKVLNLVDYISMTEKKELLMTNLIQSLTSLTGLVLFFYFLDMLVKFYCHIVGVKTVRFLASLAIKYQVRLAIADQDPYVFISHSGDQNDLVLRCLLPFIEQSCHRKVISSHEDCVPGSSIVHSHIQNIKQSRQIIIILSESYMKEPECCRLQLEHLILPLLYEDQIPVKDVLIIKYNFQNQLPQPLRWNLDLSVMVWQDIRDTEEQLQRIQKWIATGSV